MALVLLNDVLQVTFGCRFNDLQNGLNRIQYTVTATAGPAPTDQATANALSSTVAASYKNYLNSASTYNGLRMQIVGGSPPAPGVSAITGAGPGTAIGDPLPPQVAMLFTKKTAVAGKQGVGRLYLPFWGEGDNNADSKPTAAALALGQTLATLLLNPISVIFGGTNLILTPCLTKKPGWLYVPITGNIQRTNWATQRRRSLVNRSDAPFPPL